MLQDIMINLLIARGVCKVYDWLTRPQREPVRSSTKEDWEGCLIGCGTVLCIVLLFAMICVIYMAVTDLPCFR